MRHMNMIEIQLDDCCYDCPSHLLSIEESQHFRAGADGYLRTSKIVCTKSDVCVKLTDGKPTAGE